MPSMSFTTSGCALATISKRWSIALILPLICVLLMGSPSVMAQTGSSVSLSWAASTDAAANPTLSYNIYRLSSPCPNPAPTSVASSGFTQLAPAIGMLIYKDTGVPPGIYCYFATSFLNGVESVPSNTSQVIVSPCSASPAFLAKNGEINARS